MAAMATFIVTTYERGFGGSLIGDSVHFADRIVIPYRPRIVVLYAGDNDVETSATAEQIADQFTKFDRKVHAALPSTKIVFISIKPSIRRWAHIDKIRRANRLVKDYIGKQPHLAYVDIEPQSLGADGKPTLWDVVPQMQVTLSRRQHIMINLGNPELAFQTSLLPNDGVGLARDQTARLFQPQPVERPERRRALGHAHDAHEPHAPQPLAQVANGARPDHVVRLHSDAKLRFAEPPLGMLGERNPVGDRCEHSRLGNGIQRRQRLRRRRQFPSSSAKR